MFHLHHSRLSSPLRHSIIHNSILRRHPSASATVLARQIGTRATSPLTPTLATATTHLLHNTNSNNPTPRRLQWLSTSTTHSGQQQATPPYPPKPQWDTRIARLRATPHSAWPPPTTRVGLQLNRPEFGSRSRGVDTVRPFHATARRDALPLIPGVLAIVKGTSLLTLATAFSRILISFFPLGTLATFRLARGVTWLSQDKRVPTASPEADEFYKMWCEGERGVRVTMDEALQLVHAPEKETGGIEGLLAPDGRVAYSIPLPKHWRRHDPSRKKPAEDDPKCEHDAWVKKTQRYIRASFFFLPPLPPVSVRYYNELTHQERGEVDALRRYWISLRMFKDRLRVSRVVVAMLVGVPILLLVGVWATGLERVPLTGRWRLILLTPEEEDVVATSLEGANWYKSVINLLTTPEKPAPPVLPFSDWRWQWVQSTLRHIEASTIAAAERSEQGLPRPADAPDLYPPKPSYPLRPRPRVSARLHAALPGSDAMSGLEHMELGPPYNILIMDSPDKNAFSYGFGGKGAGGIVIFTGLLDEIMKHNNAPSPPEPAPQSGGFFGGLFSSTPQRARATPQPTEEQTLHLAMVLSHEMGHLLLSHHLETLSHQQVLWPSILNFSIDLIRACIWPFTIFLGPTVNDALANVGRTSAEEMSQRLGHVGFEYKHEYEADLSALRLLAHAGFDPRAAVDEYATSVTHLEEIEKATLPWWTLFKLWESSHPSPDERVTAMREELDRWVREAQKEKEGNPVKGGNDGAWRAE